MLIRDDLSCRLYRQKLEKLDTNAFSEVQPTAWQVASVGFLSWRGLTGWIRRMVVNRDCLPCGGHLFPWDLIMVFLARIGSVTLRPLWCTQRSKTTAGGLRLKYQQKSILHSHCRDAAFFTKFINLFALGCISQVKHYRRPLCVGVCYLTYPNPLQKLRSWVVSFHFWLCFFGVFNQYTAFFCKRWFHANFLRLNCHTWTANWLKSLQIGNWIVDDVVLHRFEFMSHLNLL